MAHFARIQDNIVIDRHVVENSVIIDNKGKEQEKLGQKFLSVLWGGKPSEYIQCSYNSSFRGIYPNIGSYWDGKVFFNSIDEIDKSDII